MKLKFTALALLLVLCFGIGCATVRGPHPSAIYDDLATAVEIYNASQDLVVELLTNGFISVQNYNALVPVSETAHKSITTALRILRELVAIQAQLAATETDNERVRLAVEIEKKRNEATAAKRQALIDATQFQTGVNRFKGGN